VHTQHPDSWCIYIYIYIYIMIRINVLLDHVHRPRFHKTLISLRFGDCLCPRPQVYKIKGGEG
jgi:hypothetical protein